MTTWELGERTLAAPALSVPLAMSVVPLNVLVVPPSVTMPAPSRLRPPLPVMLPLNEAVEVASGPRLMARVPAVVTLPTIEPVVPLLPSCSVAPASMTVPPR